MDKVEDCLSDFRACLYLTAEKEHYPLIHWLYTSYCELGRYKEAQEYLSLCGSSSDGLWLQHVRKTL